MTSNDGNIQGYDYTVIYFMSQKINKRLFLIELAKMYNKI